MSHLVKNTTNLIMRALIFAFNFQDINMETISQQKHPLNKNNGQLGIETQ